MGKKKNRGPQYLRDAQRARRKAEMAAGLRDGRFVGKTIPDKRRKKKTKQAESEQEDL